MFYPTHFPKSCQARISTRRTTTKMCGKFRAISWSAVVPSSLQLVPHPHYRNRREETASVSYVHMDKIRAQDCCDIVASQPREWRSTQSGGSVAHVPSGSSIGNYHRLRLCCGCLMVDNAHHHQQEFFGFHVPEVIEDKNFLLDRYYIYNWFRIHEQVTPLLVLQSCPFDKVVNWHKLQEWTTLSMQHGVWHRGTLYYSSSLIKTFTHKSTGGNAVDHKLPVHLGRFFVLFRSIVRNLVITGIDRTMIVPGVRGWLAEIE